jgi:hypothetical protein
LIVNRNAERARGRLEEAKVSFSLLIKILNPKIV